MKPFFDKTDAGVQAVQRASDIGGLPANIENDITTVTDDISPSRIEVLQGTLKQPQDVFSVIGNYAADINDMIALADQVDQGVSDATLASDVQAYNAMALAKEQASEQRGLLNNAFASPTEVNVAYVPGSQGRDRALQRRTVTTLDPVQRSPPWTRTARRRSRSPTARSSSTSTPSTRRPPRPRR